MDLPNPRGADTRVPIALGHLEFFCRDTEASRRFYEEVLGFTVVEIQALCVWLRCGSIEILLRPGEPQRARSYQQGTTCIVLYCEDLSTTLEQVVGLGLQVAGTDGAPNCPTFQDPDGRWFQLVDPRNHT